MRVSDVPFKPERGDTGRSTRVLERERRFRRRCSRQPAAPQRNDEFMQNFPLTLPGLDRSSRSNESAHDLRWVEKDLVGR